MYRPTSPKYASDEEIESTDICSTPKRNIVITGFGLFRDHTTNPSWEAIKDGQLKIDRDVNVITKQVSVSYDEVDNVVPALWEEYQPTLMVHIGLAAHRQKIGIEQRARLGPYIHDDVNEKAPHKDLRVYNDENSSCKYVCKPCKFSCIPTQVDVQKVCDMLNKAFEDGKIVIPAEKSDEAGLYVCEYIYQKSLRFSTRAVFIHVPDTSKFTIEEIRTALKYAIEALLDVIDNTVI